MATVTNRSFTVRRGITTIGVTTVAAAPTIGPSAALQRAVLLSGPEGRSLQGTANGRTGMRWATCRRGGADASRELCSTPPCSRRLRVLHAWVIQTLKCFYLMAVLHFIYLRDENHLARYEQLLAAQRWLKYTFFKKSKYVLHTHQTPFTSQFKLWVRYVFWSIAISLVLDVSLKL